MLSELFLRVVKTRKRLRERILREKEKGKGRGERRIENSRIRAHQPRTPIRVISQTLHLGSETIGASTGRFLWAERNVSSTEEMLLNGGWMLAFFVKSQHDRFFESLGCRAGHILDRLAMRDSPESRCV